MNLNSISDEHLITCFQNAVSSERKITNQVLACIGEIDRRKLYPVKGYTSLFDFLVKHFGYSPGAAMRRIDAARLLRELPETAQKFQEGTLTLSQATQVQRASRELKKIKKESLSTENKRELILQIENSTQKRTEQIIASTLDLPFVPQQKETLHRDQSVTLTITFTQEQIQILQKAQNMISHTVVSQDWAEALTYLARREVKRRTSVREMSSVSSVGATQVAAVAAVKTIGSVEVAPATASVKAETSANFEVTPLATISKGNDEMHSAANAAVNPNNQFNSTNKRRALPAAVRKGLLHGNAVCAYKDANGQACGSQRFLQIDHIHSRSRGGTNNRENLQILCGVHNRFKFQNE